MTLHDHCFAQCHFVYVTMNGKNGCAILAGGAGSRMGHVNKASLEYGGKTFMECIMAEMSSMGMPCYLSVANYWQNTPEGWKLVRDLVTGRDGGYIGPMGGIYSCLRQAAADGLDGLFFAPCDAPRFTSEIARKLSEYIEPDTDAILWRTSDGKLQTTFAWYSVRCISAMKEDINNSKYKIIKTLSKIRCRIIDTAGAGLEDGLFSNINSPEDYLELTSDHNSKHVLICGKKQTGKTTLIERVMQEVNVPVYGYSTKIFRDNADGISRVYMYPASSKNRRRGTDNYIGSTRDKVLDVRSETFELLGTELIRSAGPDGILVMDEIGFMENGALDFRKAVTEAFDGDIHILASIKDTDKNIDHIENIRNHPNSELIMLTEENRDQMTMKVMSIVSGWEQDISGRKECRDE